MTKEHCGIRLKKALAIRGMKQSELSEITGVSKSAISQYLSGSFEPKQDRVEKFARALNVSEAWLMGYDTSIERNSIVDKSKNNTVLIIGRDGRQIEKRLTDEQVKALEMMIGQFPDVPDGL